MLEKTSRKEKLLAGAAGTTLALGLAVSVGALPGAGAGNRDSVMVASRVEQVTAAPALLVEPLRLPCPRRWPRQLPHHPS